MASSPPAVLRLGAIIVADIRDSLSPLLLHIRKVCLQDKSGGQAAKAVGRDAGKRQTQLISPMLSKGGKAEPGAAAKKLDQHLKKLNSGSKGASLVFLA